MVKELKEKRTRYSKTFDINDGSSTATHRLVSSAAPIHFERDGAFEDIDTTIKGGRVRDCDYDVELIYNKIGYVGTAPDGKAISLYLDEPWVEPVIEGNKATYPNVSPDVDLQIIFHPQRIQVNRILKSAAAKKSADFVVKREAGIKGKLVNLGADAEGKKTKLIHIEQPTGKPDEVRITQTWTGDVAIMNKQTHKKEWKTDAVEYPVVIDPTSTFIAVSNGWFNAASVYADIMFMGWYSSALTDMKGWAKFSGITIPQSSTITSARIYWGVYNFYALQALDSVGVYMVDRVTMPALNATQMNSFFNSKKIGAVRTAWSQRLYGTPPSTSFGTTPQASVPAGTSDGALPTPTYPYKWSRIFDVQSLVDTLVQASGYSNDSMMLMTTAPAFTSSGYAYSGIQNEPVLVIDFIPAAAPVPADKTTYNFA